MSSKNTPKPLLLETIKIDEGVIQNLPYHQQRCTKSRKKLYNSKNVLLLKDVIIAPQKGCYRCRIIYADTIQSIEYIPYKAREIRTLKIVPAEVEYDLKYAKRDVFDSLLRSHADADDIIIQKDGYLTDTSIANIAFYDGNNWCTPSTPLLEGTMRQKLLDTGFLQKINIQTKDLHKYTQVALMNAMLGFKVLKDFKILT